MRRVSQARRCAVPMLAATTEPTEAASRRAGVAGLYAVTPDWTDTDRLVRAVAAAVRGGARVVQYRNKIADAALRLVQARALARSLQASGALLIVNDDAQLAADVRADGVHIGEEDGALAAARALVGPKALIGVSCYNDPARARAAVREGADYVAFGSFFASMVKPGARRADIALLAEAQGLAVPVVAIGGIDAVNAAVLRDAGADAVAVISAVFAAGDDRAIEAAARAIAAVFHSPAGRTP